MPRGDFSECLDPSICCVVDIGKDSHPTKPWHSFNQNVESLAINLACENTDACCVAVRPRHRVYEIGPQQIVCNRNNRNSFRHLLCGADCLIPYGYNSIRPGSDQLLCILRKQVEVLSKHTPFDPEVLAFHET